MRGSAQGMTEAVILDIWSQTLGIPRDILRLEDDFFHLGGDSLAVLAVSKKLVELGDGGTGQWPEDGIVEGALSPKHFYAHRSAAALAAYIDRSGCSASWPPAAATLQSSGVPPEHCDGERCGESGEGAEDGGARWKAVQLEQRDLRDASARGDVEEVRRILAAGAYPGGGEGKDGSLRTGLSPLHAAANAGQEEVAKVLLAAGAGPNAKQFFYKRSPAQVAAAAGCASVLRLLLAHGAAARVRDKSRLTLMHDAARGGNVECIQLLLDAGAAPDVAARDKWGRTPLFWSVLNGHSAVARRLLEMGATPAPPLMPNRIQRRRTSLVQPPSARALAARVLPPEHPLHALLHEWERRPRPAPGAPGAPAEREAEEERERKLAPGGGPAGARASGAQGGDAALRAEGGGA